MRVAIVADYPQSEARIIGGNQSVVVALAHALCELGSVEVHVVAPTASRGERQVRGGVHVHRIKQPPGPAILTYWSLQARAIRRALGAIAPDVVHFQGLYGWSLGYRGAAVVTVHGIPERDVGFTSRLPGLGRLKSLLLAGVENYARRRIRNHIIISQYVLDLLGNRLPGQHHVIANPVDDACFAAVREANAPQSSRVLFVGRIRPLKNVLGLIRAFAGLVAQHPGAVLEIIGAPDQPWYGEECRRLIRQLSLDGAVRVHGAMSRQEVLAQYRSCACVVLPSFQEVSPMTIEEAMAVGVPVIASAVGGVPYMIEDGVNGYLFPAGDDAALTACMRKLLGDAELNRRLGLRARAHAWQHYHAGRIAERTRAVYERLVA